MPNNEKNMVEDEAIAPFTTEAGGTGHISVKGKNNRIIDYNVIRYVHSVLKKLKSLDNTFNLQIQLALI